MSQNHTKMINIQGKEHSYNDHQVVNFNEGLVGFPEMHRAVLIPLAEYVPFCWLASLDNENVRFIVVNPKQVFDSYQPKMESADEAETQTLALVKISSDWRKTTVNLKAPIFINSKTRSAAQVILNDSTYQLAESLPNT